MGIRSRLSEWRRQRAVKLLTRADNVGGWPIFPFQEHRPYYSDVDFKELVKKYTSWVYACASKNAISCAQIPLRLYATRTGKTTKALFPTKSIPIGRMEYLLKSPTALNYIRKAQVIEEVTEHPFLALMQNVNDFMNQFDLLEHLFLSQDITGNAYWIILRQSPLNVPSEIWPMQPQFIKPIPSKDKFIERYEYAISSTEKHLIEPEDMIHFKYINLKDAILGLGPLQACIVAADLGISMNEYETGLFQNRAIPDWAMVMPPETGKPNPDMATRIEKEWAKKYRGTKKGGKLAFLYGGADLKQISLSPKEMSFLQGRKASKEEVAAIFGVPLSKITVENVNRANAEAGDYSYMKDTIRPRLLRAEQKLNERLLPMFDERLFCAFDNPIPEDKNFRLKETTEKLKVGYMSINQARQEDGQEEVKWGDIPYMPMNMVQIGTELPPTLPPMPPKSKTKAPRRLPPLEHPTNFVNQPLVLAIQGYYEKQRNEILADFDRDMGKAVIKGRYGHKQDPSDFLSGWFDMQKWNGELARATEPFIRYTLMSGGERALRSITVEREFDPLNPRVMRSLEKIRTTRTYPIVVTDAKKLRKTLADGMGLGEGVSDLRKRIEGMYDGEMTRNRATVIARTETIWAWNEGAVQGYVQSGLVEKKQWVSSGDPRSCDYCLDMDGKIIGVEGYFFEKGGTLEVAGNTLNFDYEDVGHPPLHAQCRCTIVPIIEGI